MKAFRIVLFLLIAGFITACEDSTTTSNTPDTQEKPQDEVAADTDSLRYPGEKHFKNVRQLTFGGNNAEAYWSFDGKMLSFQSDYKEWGVECDQIFYMPMTGHGENPARMVSTGLGRTTCAYFMPDGQHILYASTHIADKNCPEVPHRGPGGKYVWPIYDTYDIYKADLEGKVTGWLTQDPGYDAEATVSPDGQKIVFTSTRSGDLELWTMNIDGSEPQQITNELGYDGGAFFSPDSKKLVWRSSRPKTPEAQAEYKKLLAEGLVEPTDLEVYVANVDGSDMRKITDIGKANWAPSWHPSGEKIIFASNHKSESGRQFNLFLVNLDGSGLEQISFDGTFDAFPMFSPDGKYVAFSSNRFNGGGRDTNIFIAEWVE